MTVFITGGTGFAGRNLIEFLLDEHPDTELVCLVRSPEKAAFLKGRPNVRIVEGDLLDPASYREGLKDAGRVIHAAAMVGLKNGREFYTANTEATRLLIEAAKRTGGVERFTFVSSISAIDRPPDKPALDPLTEETPPHPNTDYGKSKLLAEEWVIRSGLPYTILRPSYIYGPHPRIGSSMDRLVYDVRDQKPYTTIPLPGKASEIHVRDLARLIWLAASHPNAENEVFFAANPDPVVVGDVFPVAAEALGVPHRFRPVDDDTMGRLKRYCYHKYAGNPLMKVMFENSFWCSPRKLIETTGYQPSYPLTDGIWQTVGWYRQHGSL